MRLLSLLVSLPRDYVLFRLTMSSHFNLKWSYSTQSGRETPYV